MKTLLMVASLATVVFLPLGSAQAQGSNQAADDATNWAPYGGHSGGAYASYGNWRQYQRREWR